MDDQKDILEVVNFIKDRMLTKDDVRGIVKEEVRELTDKVTAIEGKLDGFNRRVDYEAERDFEQDVRIKKLEEKVF